MFDLSNVTLAFVQANDAAASFDAMTADMLQWHESGIYPSNQELIAALTAAGRWGAGTCKVYASNLLAWAKSGETPRNISQVVKGKPVKHVKGKGGRPAGQGKGKSTAPTEDKAQAEKPTVPNHDAAWRQFLETMRAQVPSRKDWASSDIVAFQESCAAMIALIKRNAK